MEYITAPDYLTGSERFDRLREGVEEVEHQTHHDWHRQRYREYPLPDCSLHVTVVFAVR